MGSFVFGVTLLFFMCQPIACSTEIMTVDLGAFGHTLSIYHDSIIPLSFLTKFINVNIFGPRDFVSLCPEPLTLK